MHLELLSHTRCFPKLLAEEQITLELIGITGDTDITIMFVSKYSKLSMDTGYLWISTVLGPQRTLLRSDRKTPWPPESGIEKEHPAASG